MKTKIRKKTLFLTALVVSCSGVLWGAEEQTKSEDKQILLTNKYGETEVIAPDKEIPAMRGYSKNQAQIPTHKRGSILDDRVLERQKAAHVEEWDRHTKISKPCVPVLFPANQPPMGKSLATIDQFGNTAIQPGAILKKGPITDLNQKIKYYLSNYGFDYSLHMAHVLASMDNRVAGTPSFQQYATSVLEFRWNLLKTGCDGTWLNFEMDSSYGLGERSKRQASLQNATGTAANPNNGVFSPNGSYVVELALMQSFNKGQGVFIFGMVDRTNYFDTNAYSNTEYGQFMNTALCNSMVLPLSFSNLGGILQYQLNDAWYMMFSIESTNTQMSHDPFNNLSMDDVSYLAEFGWSDPHALGLGRGTYRIQPFLATVEGETQPGIGLNFTQDLGNSPWAIFGRLGVGGNKVTTLRGAQAQFAGGVALKRPLALLGILSENSNNFLGVSGIWTKTPGPSQAAGGRDETGIEITYSIQVSPSVIIQPDFQIFFNPANNSSQNVASIFQLQVSSSW